MESTLPVFPQGIGPYLNDVRMLFKIFANVQNGPERRFEALKCVFLVLMGGSLGPKESLKRHPHFTYLLKLLLRFLDIDLCEGGEESFFDESPLDTKHLEQVKMQLRRVCSGRRIFIVNDTFGIGPAGLQSGDIIAVLFGSPWPLALRRVESYYRILGPCYVYKMMDGEVVRRRQEEESHPQVLEIR